MREEAKTNMYSGRTSLKVYELLCPLNCIRGRRPCANLRSYISNCTAHKCHLCHTTRRISLTSPRIVLTSICHSCITLMWVIELLLARYFPSKSPWPFPTAWALSRLSKHLMEPFLQPRYAKRYGGARSSDASPGDIKVMTYGKLVYRQHVTCSGEDMIAGTPSDIGQ